jgi:hypothetical protein
MIFCNVACRQQHSGWCDADSLAVSKIYRLRILGLETLEKSQRDLVAPKDVVTGTWPSVGGRRMPTTAEDTAGRLPRVYAAFRYGIGFAGAVEGGKTARGFQ